MPFCNLHLTGRRTPDFPIAYERHPKTLGEHLRKERLFRGLKQRDVAERLGVRTETVANWERGHGQTLARHYGAVVNLLGFDPKPPARTLSERLRAVRFRLGLTQEQMAARLGQDEKQVCRWERGARQPHPWIAQRLELTLRTLEGNPSDPSAPASFFDLTRWRRTVPAGLEIAPRTAGERLRARRLERGLTISDLARKVGVSRGTIYRIERGLRQTGESMTRKLLKALQTERP